MTIEALNTASFLCRMQEQGARGLDEVTEDAVLSFFVSEDGSLQKSCSYKKNISAVFKAGLKWKESQCRRILSFLPLLRETRKNIQYLTQDEIRLLRDAVENGGTTAHNKAVILLLLFTGLRGCDVRAALPASWQKSAGLRGYGRIPEIEKAPTSSGTTWHPPCLKTASPSPSSPRHWGIQPRIPLSLT